MTANTGYELDWDSTIEADEQQFKKLEAGNYDFIVDHVERTFVGGTSEKYAGMKMAVVYLNIQVPGQEDIQLKENFILHTNFQWKIGSLLVSVGLKKKGEPITGNYWNRLPGTRGRCEVTLDKDSKSNREYNHIKQFFEPSSKADNGQNKWAI